MIRFFAESIKTFCFYFLNGLLAASMILGPSTSLSAEIPAPENVRNKTESTVEITAEITVDSLVPKVEGLDIESIQTTPDGEPISLPLPLEQISQARVNAVNSAPAWVKNLRSRSVSDYFPKNLDDKSEAWQQAKAQLLADSQRLHQYFEEQDQSGLYKDFIDKKLSPFVKTLDAKKITSALRDHNITRPIGEWTVETLVVTEQISYLGRSPNFVKKVMSLLTGRHLRGAGAIAGAIALSAVGVFTAHHFGYQVDFRSLPNGAWTAGVGVGVFLGRILGGAFQAGPLAAILNAATSWFIQPTTEFVKIITSRHTGRLEQWMNHFYDRFKPAASPGLTDAQRNETPNLATVDRDGMDFAGMSSAEQKQNWDKNLRMWVAVAKTFGQLLRGTHHEGRVLMMIAWADEQHTTTLVETMDSKLIGLSLEAEARLTPYKSAILSDAKLDSVERKNQLAQFQEYFEQYETLSEKIWMDLGLSELARNELTQQIEEYFNQLSQVMTPQDLAKIASIQMQRNKAVRTLVTALTLNEIRSFNVAESNRNLESEARQAQRVIRNGFHLQDYVDKYREHVQTTMEKMGYSNAIKNNSAINTISCHSLFIVGPL